MIVPSIDLMDGQAVQLVGGEAKALDAGDPRPIAERFARVGPIAVIDLDAALGRGSNAAVIVDLVRRFPCRVGGGVRDADTARRWLDLGAEQVILGTRAVPEVLSELPAERVIAALDARHGEVVVEGWRTGTGAGIVERMRALRPWVGGFLVTFVEREGRLGGTDLGRVRGLVEAADGAALTIAGGVTTAEELAAVDTLGADAQVGMAIYTGRLDLGDAFAAPLRARSAGPWPVLVVDVHGVAVAFDTAEAATVRRAVAEGRALTRERDHGPLAGLRLDRARRAIRMQLAGAAPRSDFGSDDGLPALARRLRALVDHAPEGSYTRRLLADPALLRAKLVEEAGELADAEPGAHAAEELADVLYFALVAAARAGVRLEDAARILDRRALRLVRRRGDAKPGALPPADAEP